MNLKLSQLFTGPHHQPFQFDAGDPVVVLLHGFPGTPAEMRAIGKHLQAAGMSAYGLLLPGFGGDLDRLFETTAADWVGAVVDCLQILKSSGREVVLLGYSFGSAVALHAAAAEKVSGLVLTAPFWRIGGARERWIWRLTRWLFPGFKPFRRIDFSNPQIRGGLEKMLPGIDTDRPEVQQALRDLRVPASFVDEIMGLGASAKEKAREIQAPVLILQGSEDEVISPAFTRELAEAFNRPPDYREVAAGHDLLETDSRSLATVAEVTTAFIRKLNERRGG